MTDELYVSMSSVYPEFLFWNYCNLFLWFSLFFSFRLVKFQNVSSHFPELSKTCYLSFSSLRKQLEMWLYLAWLTFSGITFCFINKTCMNWQWRKWQQCSMSSIVFANGTEKPRVTRGGLQGAKLTNKFYSLNIIVICLMMIEIDVIACMSNIQR